MHSDVYAQTSLKAYLAAVHQWSRSERVTRVGLLCNSFIPQEQQPGALHPILISTYPDKCTYGRALTSGALEYS